MGLIFLASSDVDSGPRGSRILAPIIRWLVPDISAESLDQAIFVARKGVHFVTFGILAGLVWWALSGSRWDSTPSRRVFCAALITLACAIGDEFHQSLVPSRVGSPWDVIIDTLGAAVVLTGIWRVSRRGRRG